MALSLDLNRRVVVYRVRGGTGLLTLVIDKWQELVDAEVLRFAGVAKRNT